MPQGTLTYITAREEMFKFFTDKWNAANVEYTTELRYQGKADPARPAILWAKLSSQEVASPEAGFMMCGEGQSQQTYSSNGLFFCQVNAAIILEDAFYKGGFIATVARGILRSANTPNGIWFRNARIMPIAPRPDDKEFKWNVVAEYLYDEIAGC